MIVFKIFHMVEITIKKNQDQSQLKSIHII